MSYISTRGRVSADDDANQAAAKPSRTAAPAGCCLPDSGSSKAMLVAGPLPIVTKSGLHGGCIGKEGRARVPRMLCHPRGHGLQRWRRVIAARA